MYIVGGEKVYPAEVENVLAEMEGVADAAVIGVPDLRLGQSGVAYVVLKPSASLSEESLIEWCAERLARYKRPRQVRFVDAIPRNASGKIEKDALELAWAHEHTEGPFGFVYPS
jgi:fatty-acyl-CoA synthase